MVKFVPKVVRGFSPFLADNYRFKVNKRNTRTRCEICSQLTIKTLRSSALIVNFEQVNAAPS